MSLGTCEGCRRFARFGVACPFCGSAIAEPRSRKPGRRARNGVLAAVAITAAACGGTTVSGSDASMDAQGDTPADAMEDMAPIPFYGAPTWDAGPWDSGPTDGGTKG